MDGPKSPEPSLNGRLDDASPWQQTADIGSQGDLQAGLTPIEQPGNQTNTYDAQLDSHGHESPEMALPEFDNQTEDDTEEDPYKRVYTPALPKTEAVIEEARYSVPDDDMDEVKGTSQVGDPPTEDVREQAGYGLSENIQSEYIETGLLVDPSTEDTAGESSPRKSRKKKKKKKRHAEDSQDGEAPEQKVMLQHHAESSGSLNVRLPPIGRESEALQEGGGEDTNSSHDPFRKPPEFPMQSGDAINSQGQGEVPPSLYPVLESQHYSNESEKLQCSGEMSEVRQRTREVHKGQGHDHVAQYPTQHRRQSVVIGAERDESPDGWGSQLSVQKGHDTTPKPELYQESSYTNLSYHDNTVVEPGEPAINRGLSDIENGHQDNLEYTPDLPGYGDLISLPVYNLPVSNDEGRSSRQGELNQNGAQEDPTVSQSDLDQGHHSNQEYTPDTPRHEDLISLPVYDLPVSCDDRSFSRQGELNDKEVRRKKSDLDLNAPADGPQDVDVFQHRMAQHFDAKAECISPVQGGVIMATSKPLHSANRSSRARQRSSRGQRPGESEKQRLILERKKSNLIGTDDDSVGGIGCCGWILYIFSILLIAITLPFSLVFTIKVVQEYERAVIFRLGRLPSGGAKGPGIFFIIPCIENYTKIDLRTVTFDVPPQEVLTKDSVTVQVDAVVYYQVSNPTVSVANVENAHHSTRLLAQTTLRNILGTKNMSEILSDREGISHGMKSTLDDATDRWGIKVERVEIKDVRLPVQLQRAMAAEAEASREARAKVIAAEGEYNASRALKDAASIMDSSAAALQLRYLQTLNSISAEKNSTIIFPVPIDLLGKKKL